MQLIQRLRGENGCPWDKKQTPATLSVYLIEEMYELVDAIGSKSPEDVCEELGDVLFQLLFIADIFHDSDQFDIQDAARLNLQKMIRRHPHVFGEATAATSEDVRRQWHRIKTAEKKSSGDTGIPAGVLDSVPTGLPALLRAYRISERAARTGFDWTSLSGVMEKVEEEWAEFKAEVRKIETTASGSGAAERENLSLEFGDLLFTLVNVARFARIHPETSLADAIRKFEKRFRHMEAAALQDGVPLESVSHDDFNRLWENAKSSIG